MARLFVVVRAAPALLVAAACAGNNNDGYQPPGSTGQDAAVDASAVLDGPAIDTPPGIDAGSAIDAPPSDAPPHSAELSIAISDAPDPVAASGTVTYTIDVTDDGDLDANNVTVIQRLPSGNVQFVSATGIGWNCSNAGQLVTCTRATLLVGTAPSIVVTLTAPPSGGTISTSATVTADTPDADHTNNSANATTLVLTPADLSIAMTDTPDPVSAGGSLGYAITVTNLGPGVANSLRVFDSLPSGLVYTGASGGIWSCSAVNQDVTCTLPSLAVSASSTLTLAVTAPSSGGTVTDTASVSAATPDSSPGNNAATVSTTVSAAADLSITLHDSPDPVFVSGTLQYLIDVTNIGPNTASGITVTDSLPAGNVAFVDATGSGWSCSASGQVVNCTRPSLLVGAAPTIVLTVRAPSDPASLSNTASVTSTSSDLVSNNNTAVVATTVAPAADLSVTVVDSPDPATTGGPLSYTVTASNAGPSVADNPAITSILPSGATVLDASGSGWTCTVNGRQVRCTAPQLPVGTASAITINTTAPGTEGTVTETSSIGSDTADPSSANNAASESTLVNAPAELSLALSASANAAAHSLLTYTIGITNLGPRDATNLVVTNRLPDGNVLFQSATGIGWTCALAGQIVTCTRPSLLVGAAPSIAIQIQTPDVPGSLTDTATVSASTADVDQDNNTRTVSTDVFDSADLSITATDAPDPVRVGQNLTYTLSVANAGPTAAGVVTVTDTLPAGTTYVPTDNSPWACNQTNQTVTCTLPGLASSSSAPSIAIVATAPMSSGNITNTATVSSTTSDPDGSNNTASSVTLANLFADLSVALADTPDPVQGTISSGCTHNDCVTYTITVHNAGPDQATGVTVTSQLPPDGSFFQAVGTDWVCPRPINGLICTSNVPLDVGATSTITLIWKAPSPGGFSIVVRSTVTGSSTDPVGDNNTVTQDTTVQP